MTKKVKFEDALGRLEKIVEQLEQGDTPLDEAIKLFEEGMQLARQCSKQLDDAEKKLHALVKTESGFQLDLLEGDV